MTNFENPVPQLDDVTNRLMALLADRQKAADAYNHVVALGVANRRFPQAELRSIRDEIERLETEIRRRVGEWVLLRGRRQLHCDISHLQTIYVDLRAELICLWGGLVVELDKISRRNQSRRRCAATRAGGAGCRDPRPAQATGPLAGRRVVAPAPIGLQLPRLRAPIQGSDPRPHPFLAAVAFVRVPGRRPRRGGARDTDPLAARGRGHLKCSAEHHQRLLSHPPRPALLRVQETLGRRPELLSQPGEIGRRPRAHRRRSALRNVCGGV